MRVGVVALLVAASLLGLLATTARPAHACSCVPLSHSERLDRADAVFAGEATAVKARPQIPLLWSSSDPVTVEFAVKKVWKGPQQKTVTITTVRAQASCGYEFQKGGTYLVYARNGATGLCDGTAPAWRAFEDIVALGDAWEPEPDPAALPMAGGGCIPFAATPRPGVDAGALALLVGVIGLGILRRPRL